MIMKTGNFQIIKKRRGKMLTNKQILEIREHLEKAQNPVFFYDNDADGLCSYVLLRRFIDRGKGVAVRSHPDVDEGYAKRAQQLNADYIFVLDRPVLGRKFYEEIKKLQLPIVWIDHHAMEDIETYEGVGVYNSAKEGDGKGEPVSYISYKVADRVEDVWIALMGCVADHHLPDFKVDFVKKYRELWGKKVKLPFDVYYNTEIGRLAQVLGFALKDSITHVIQLQNYLIKCKTPNEFMEELELHKPFAKKYRELKKKYDGFIEKAKAEFEGKSKVLFFKYGGDMSMSSEISNELSYFYQKNVILVAYSSGPITNISMRGGRVREILDEVLKEGFEGATGGGHPEAVGARLQTKDLGRFREEVEKRV
jgi:single-stranded DNA-specific DHH superfamily exonuclease